ncbi:carboxypeptidase-like regulatory domain-containing protein, partial [candidate division KSB1 bacterium]|nr:carboxypeptidase-like regulatory domain-containing protein [candidate division KSB1 bacterium]
MKMFKLGFILLLFIFCHSMVMAQGTVSGKTYGSISGVVIDEKTKEPLPGVNIVVVGTTRGTSTSRGGTFLISKLPVGTYSLNFSFIGYGTELVENINIIQDQVATLKVALHIEAIQLSEIVVTPGQFSILGAKMAPRQVLSREDIQNMSWAEDITRAVARLPGISSSDYSSKFTVRGGESDEVLINLDGMELYEPFHQRDFSGGLFSIVDIETIQGIELMTGGFSAAYGNRLSGVFNMHTKHIEPGQRHTVLGLSVMNARFYTDGTFSGGKGSYLFSTRRGMLDVLFNAAPAVEAATIDQGTTPKFYDIMGKLEYALSAKHTLAFHALRAGDQNKIEDIAEDNFDKNNTSYDNTYSWLTLKSTYNPSLYSRSILYSGLISHNRTGSFHKYEPSDKGDFSLSDKRDYTMVGLKQDLDWQASEALFLSAGFDIK